MDAQALVGALDASQKFFLRSISTLTEDDSSFSPAEGMFTTAQAVAHVALSTDWFVEGAFERPDGFAMDFEAMDNAAREYTSLETAKARFVESYGKARRVIGSQSPEQLAAPLPQGPVMGGLPRMAIVGGIEDHAAHHRGALTVYARLRGHVPPMPYME